MAVYRLGSNGPEVKKIQLRLKALGYYGDNIDSDFGGATQVAVEAFQEQEGLEVDGEVGPITWRRLFDTEIKEPAVSKKALDYRCLALTGSFETGKGIPDCFAGISGDFDEQGISFGVLQWNFGQGSLQPLLQEMVDQHGDVLRAVFQSQCDQLVSVLASPQRETMKFARSIQDPIKHFIFEPWKGMFVTLGRTEEFQGIEVRHARITHEAALQLCSEYELWSERAVALMFDIKTQNGSISRGVKAQIKQDFAGLSSRLSGEELEVAKLCVIANRRADAANPLWAEDVRARKLCCANGEGNVHGINYDLEAQYGIALKPI
jgi:hypothetical protein